MQTKEDPNVDPRELRKFDRDVEEWWDPEGTFRTLHAINAVRLRYIDGTAGLHDARVLDVGCGGGILCEAMAARGARVTGIDAGSNAIGAAMRHRDLGGMDIEYLVATAEVFSAQRAGEFDVVTCMELLEHVPDPPALLHACARLLRPGGHLVTATINRTARAYLTAVLGAEYLLRLLPRGTHDYARFIRPSELARWLRDAGFRVRDVTGLRYVPWLEHAALSNDPSVNYMAHARLED